MARLAIYAGALDAASSVRSHKDEQLAARQIVSQSISHHRSERIEALLHIAGLAIGVSIHPP